MNTHSRRARSIWVALVGFAMCTPALGAVVATDVSFSSATPQQLVKRDEAALTETVIEYVRLTRSWPAGSYTVELSSLDGGNLVFWVIYKGSTASGNAGANRSFEAVFNPKTNRVEREQGFH